MLKLPSKGKGRDPVATFSVNHLAEGDNHINKACEQYIKAGDVGGKG